MTNYDIAIIGGGATGLGCAFDLALRGLRCVLVEKGDLASGTTGRYHGLLHSGGRYVTKDPQSATECARENTILRRIMPHCLEATGGFFVITPWDDPLYGDQFVANCHKTGVPVQELALATMLRREPLLNPRITRAFEVLDGSADSFLASQSLALAAKACGAQILTYHHLDALVRDGDRVVGALVTDLRSGTQQRITCAYVLNASGAWAGQVAAMAGVKLSVVPGKGTMVAMNQRMVNTVINRCKLPADGDIIVPIHSVAVIGTTDVQVTDPDNYPIEAHEIAFMLAEGEKLIPGFSHYRALRAWAGVRPLYQDRDTPSAAERDISRTFKLLDHAARDGVEGFISIVGGKWTTCRLMAEAAANLIAQRMGNTQPCRTASEILPRPGAEGHGFYYLGQHLAAVEAQQAAGDLICECELVTRERVEAALADGITTLDDIRRTLRVGMGPCQGGWCIYRTAALLHEYQAQHATSHPINPNQALRDFLQARWKGLRPVLWGDQLRQARLDEQIYVGLLGVDRLPDV
ncbi:MAG: anaerobic glycerol-3-phosphate dehydrogenase subunit A [Candidatus Viridilinea halotolerans]|uniref:glycerol-3-phosphate dehydrogenase n=1 Tax=Candidatus Viridilinea halotolerans TaxID=2491704 RepID=A0A426TUM7_9CHLR|nr:MAG: anaerobic glycerol-3-phosphate dehydrogenase subunit A [Candidatus Viridilinea halotolerans]